MTFNKLGNLLIGLSLFTLIYGCNSDMQEENKLRNVIITQVASLSGSESTTYAGTIEEGANINASFMADGKINKILVKEGDRVYKGQLLAILDDSDYRIGVSQLETQLDQMTKEKERMDAMYKKQNIAPNDYEKFEAGYKQLKLQLDMAKRQLDYTRLYSPADGYIADRYMEPGELTGAGTPVFNIINDSHLKATVDLPVQVYLNRHQIINAKGAVPGIDAEIPLSVVSFTPDADNNMLYKMKLSIPASFSKELTSGMNISVSLLTDKENTYATRIPSRAIFKSEGQNYVWVLNPADSTISKKTVIIEGIPEGKTSIVKGLSEGEYVVETGVKQLYSGEKVNVLNRTDIGI